MNILELKRKLLPMSGPQMDGGGGGGSGTGTQTQISELPEWARGYAKSALEKGAALSETPYEKYDKPRIAGFSPMQLQSQQGAANMQTNAGTGMGMGLAGAAALGGLNQDYQGGQFSGGRFGNRQAAQYMSPYIQEAMEPQLREAARASALQSQQNAAGAVGKGAFGGSRQALVEAERQRNLATQQGDIRAKGYQTAYEQAANQFNQDSSRGLTAQQLGEQSRQFGANLGLQGLNTALQGAGQLGTLGQQQFQQGMDINKLQNAYGGQEQALRQQGLTQAYQDFQNEQNYPYKQLGFFSDLIRGIPVGQATTKTMYEPDPSMAQNLMSAGTAAYGLSKFMAEGGMAYADGGEIEGYRLGGGVDSRENVEEIVHSLRGDPNALQRAYQAAKARGDVDQIEAIEKEMAIAASLRKGIAGGVTDEMAERMAADGGLMDSYAGGGVVAFAGGGLSEYMKNMVDAYGEFKPATTEERITGAKEALPGIQSLYGESALKPFMEDLKKDRAGLSKQKEQGEGLAFLAASKAILRPGSKSRAVSEMASELGMGLAKANKDYAEANSKLRQAEMTLAASEQARNDGQIGKAEALYDKGRAEQRQFTKDKLDANKDLATIQANVDNSIRQANASMAQVNKPGERERLLSQLDDIQSGKKVFQGKTGKEGAEAFMKANADLGAAMYGVKYTGQDKTLDRLNTALKNDKEYPMLQLQRTQFAASKDPKAKAEVARIDARLEEIRAREEANIARLGGAGGESTGGVTPPPAAIEFLKANPQAKADFDAKYGAGAADRFLGK